MLAVERLKNESRNVWRRELQNDDYSISFCKKLSKPRVLAVTALEITTPKYVAKTLIRCFVTAVP